MQPQEGEVVGADLIVSGISELVVCPAYAQPGEGSPGLGRIVDAAMAVREGRIAWVGPRSRLGDEVRLLQGGVRVDAGGHMVMPGLVDPHTHLVFGGDRTEEFQVRLAGASYHDVAAAGGGILRTVDATRHASTDVLLASARRRLDRYLLYGVTTVEAKSGYGLTLEHEVRLLEVCREVDADHAVDVIPTLLAANTVPIEFIGQPDKYVDLIVKKIIPSVAKHHMAVFCDAFCEEGAFNVEQCRRVLEAGMAHGLMPKLHGDQLTSCGGAELAVDVGAVSVDHLDLVSEEGIAALGSAWELSGHVASLRGEHPERRRRAPVAVLLPGSTFFLGEGGLAPARSLLDAGVRVALGTDFNPGSSPTQNLWLIATMGCSMLGMSTEEAIRAVTIEAAFAVGREHAVGSLEVGKRADFLILEHRKSVEIPYRYGMNPVWQVYKDGRCVVTRDYMAENL